MQLLDLAADGSDGAVAFALGTADTGISDRQSVKFLTGAGRAFFVANMCKIFILEVAESAEDRVRRSLTQSAEGGVSNGLCQRFQFIEHLNGSVAVTDLLEHFEHTAGTDTAGGAFTAGFIYRKFQVEPSAVSFTSIPAVLNASRI